VAAIAVAFLLHLALIRGLSPLVTFGDLWALRADWVSHFPGWIASAHLNSLVYVFLFLAGEPAKGLLLGLAGFLLIATMLVLMLKGGFSFLERKARYGVLGLVSAILALDILLVCFSPPPDSNGLAFRQLLRSAPPLSKEQKKTRLSELISAGYKNPTLYFYAAEHSGNPAPPPDHLAAVRALSPRLWARWIETLPPERFGDEIRQQAESYRRSPFPSAYELLPEKARERGRTSKTGELRQLGRVLRFNPFDVAALRRSAEILEGKGRLAEAQQFRSRLQRYLETQMDCFFALERRFVPWRVALFREHFLHYAIDLSLFYSERGQSARTLALADRLGDLVADEPFFQEQRKLLRTPAVTEPAK